jgi:hypothetical protein
MHVMAFWFFPYFCVFAHHACRSQRTISGITPRLLPCLQLDVILLLSRASEDDRCVLLLLPTLLCGCSGNTGSKQEPNQSRSQDKDFIWKFTLYTDEAAVYNICWYLKLSFYFSLGWGLGGNGEVHVCTYNTLQPSYACSMEHLGIHMLTVPLSSGTYLYREGPIYKRTGPSERFLPVFTDL